MDNIKWAQSRNTKLGHATIEIAQVQDLYEATVSFRNSGIDFTASETFGDDRSAKYWAYGVKQSMNDDFAGFQRHGENLVETKPKKGCVAKVLSISLAIAQVQDTYDNFALGKSFPRKDTISTSEVKASNKLSEEEKITLANLMAKAKGVKNG